MDSNQKLNRATLDLNSAPWKILLWRIPILLAVLVPLIVVLSGCSSTKEPVQFSFKPEAIDLMGLETKCASGLKGPTPEDIQSDYHFVEYFNREIVIPYAECRDNHNKSMDLLKDRGYIK